MKLLKGVTALITLGVCALLVSCGRGVEVPRGDINYKEKAVFQKTLENITSWFGVYDTASFLKAVEALPAPKEIQEQYIGTGHVDIGLTQLEPPLILSSMFELRSKGEIYKSYISLLVTKSNGVQVTVDCIITVENNKILDIQIY